MSSTAPDHHDHPDHAATPGPGHHGAVHPHAVDEAVHTAHHSVRHHLRNTRFSAQAALSHAREALQQVASSAQAGSQPIATDLKEVLQELDQAIQALRADSSDQVVLLRQALQGHADRLHQIARHRAAQVRDTAVRSVDYTQQRVIDDPLKAVGIAAGVGLVLGLWLGRCARD